MNQQKLKTTGIMRNKMGELLRLKGRKKMPIKRFSKASLRKAIDQDEFIKSSLLSDSTKTTEIQMATFDQPAWIANYKECVSLLNQVQNLQNEISKEKKRKLSSVFEKKHDLVIQKFVEEATIKLNKCEKKLKEMEIRVNFDRESSSTNKKTFTSMMMAMASNIREEARKLRGQQQSELHRQRQLSKYDNTLLKGASIETSQTESWLSEQDFQMMQKNFIKERNEQVNKIVQSISSLNSIYKELQNLVIQQGSLLDRIDENIDHTVQHVKKANEHLQEANKKQQSTCFVKLRLFLIIIIAVLFSIFILKHS